MKSDAFFLFLLLETFLKCRTEHKAALCGGPIVKLLYFVLCQVPRYDVPSTKPWGWWIIRWKIDLFDTESLMSIRRASYTKEPFSPLKYINNNTLILWSRILPEKLIVTTLVKKFPPFMEYIYILISVIKSPCHWPKFQFYDNLFKIRFHILFSFTPTSSKWYIRVRSLILWFYCIESVWNAHNIYINMSPSLNNERKCHYLIFQFPSSSAQLS